MDLILTTHELVALALPNGLPRGVSTPVLVRDDLPGDAPASAGVAPAGDVLVVDVDPREVPGLPGAARLAARAAGTVTVRVRIVEVTSGHVRCDVAAAARGLPAHRLVGLVRGPVEAALQRRLVARGIASDAVRLVPDGDRLEVIADTAALLAPAPLPAHLRGLRVTDLRLADGRARLSITLP
ncbi:hypothetical protein [Sanguibacter massiliensis]|uniref:hypothetical protein n=1 Tax=Sanguibacter massiliensis TaxID=1973217 RepID=UPI000C85D365|nr:hypothetical protein [Sanguibacter massiliensis]